MAISQITLKDYDTVVAVTQNSINETLAVYLNGLQKQVGLYYNVDEQGNFVPAQDPSSADYIFTGTLDYTLDANGNPVDMVMLYTDKGVQTLAYNITFSNAEFKSTVPPKFDVSQQAGGNPWVISFLVDLKNAEVTLSELPAATQAAVKNATKDLPADMFSIQQLYLDLNNSVFDSFQNITGMNTFAGTILTGIMQSYLASLQKSGGIIFGYSIKLTPSNVPPPTFAPTALDFCVTPYTDNSGNHSNPGLDTLNYLIMTNNNALPPQPPSAFGFNWVDDPTIQGTMAVRHGLYINFLIGQLNGMLQTISPVPYVKADANKTCENQTMQLNAGSPAKFTLVSPPQNGVIATYSYNPAPASDTDNVFGGGQSVSLTYSSSCSVSANGPLISISGASVVSADSTANSMGSVDEVKMPATTFSWSVDLRLQMDPNQNGELGYGIENPNFNSAPTVAPNDESAWQKFLDAGCYTEFASDPGGIRETISTNILGQIQQALANSIKTANNFVFPGGATFLFKNPGLTNTDDLAANITYMTPDAASLKKAAGSN
jgi:hypothetical protein